MNQPAAPRPAAQGRVRAVVLSYGDSTIQAEQAACSAVSEGVARNDVLIVHNPKGSPLPEREAEFRVLEQRSNLGYGPSVNAGIDEVLDGADYVLVMTHDTRFRPGCLAALVQRLASSSRVGIVGPVLLHADSEVFSVGGFMTRRETGHVRESVDHRGLLWIDGAALLARAEVLKQMRFDERFFLYWEDVEFSLAAQRLGWGVEVVQGAFAVQRVGLASLGRAGFYLDARNRLEVYRRAFGWPSVMWQIACLLRRSLARAWRAWPAEGARGAGEVFFGTWSGIMAFLMRRFGKPLFFGGEVT